MLEAKIPENEPQRLHALRQYKTIMSSARNMLHQLTTLAAAICDAPVSLVSLVHEDEQRFASIVGLSTGCTSRDISFCGHAIHQDDLFIIRDTHDDDRFVDNPLVTGEPHIRFYAGAPLKVSEGIRLGTLCVFDRRPRELNETQKETLRTLGAAVVDQLELQRALHDLDRIEDLLPICAWCRSVKDERGDWRPLHDYVTTTANVTHGLCPACSEAELRKLRNG